ncbi:zinc ABC transporter substrate-binding protein [Nocardioides iriomotensis]|uniref:Zinc ABC transporter substrate-binding protein n=2 Tax=Nocardioides iriomotensis TaxID=715784 RepID=A0A4Q5IUA8_9ACTN|nr:zinc ABC transporter substrate-binding protein [Nocardioides iriomotensis]
MIPMRRRLLALLGPTVLVPTLAACGAVGADDSDGPSVVASFYPLQYVAERVAGDHADVEALTSPGQEPHDLELTFKRTVEVAEADVVVFLSGFQPAVDDAVEQGGSEHVVDAADVADLRPAAESEEEHASHADEEAHDHGALDPHFWLDPTRLAKVADAVEQQLAEADPDHADDYAANLAALQDDLTALDDDLMSGLEDCRVDTIVVSHNAFAYFAERYGLHVESINGMTPDAEPSPAHLAQLSDLIETEGITTVFSETLATRELADTLAGELGLGTAVLDPVEGLADAGSDDDYLSLMRGNLAAIQEANECT